MDQACAYGQTPVHIRFDGDLIDVTPLRVGAPLYWVFADLRGQKDTVRILRDLNSAYPFPNDAPERALHGLLGEENRALIDEAIAAIAQGDAARVGTLMHNA